MTRLKDGDVYKISVFGTGNGLKLDVEVVKSPQQRKLGTIGAGLGPITKIA